MIDVSICMVSLNCRQVLEACLASIYKSIGAVNFEIILVDNASTDGTLEYVEQYFPEITLIRNDNNAGFAQATNQAMTAASGKYLLWLNTDTVIQPDSLEKLIQFMEEHPLVGIVGPKVLNADGTMQNQCRRGFPTPWASLSYFLGLSKLFPRSPFFARYLLTYLDENESNEVDAVSGCCLLVRRKVVEQTGLIDTIYHSYGEDLDFCAEAKKAGWQVFFYPSTTIIHYGGKGGSGVKPFYSIFHFYRSMWLFYRKQIAHRYMFFVNWMIGGAITAKFVYTILSNFLRKQKVVGSVKP